VYSEKTRLRLGHILENSERVADYIAGQDFLAFSGSRITIDAVERCLSRITEASVRIGDEALIKIAPDVPMHVLRSFGNALRHDYDRIDLPTIWKTVQNDLPLLRAACERALSES